VKKLPSTAFQKGCAPGPGRPKGVRNRLTELVTTVLSEDFEQHGVEVIKAVRAKYPQIYLSCVVSLLPKQQQVEKLSPLGELSDAELEELQVHLASVRAKLVRQLEQHNGAAIDEQQQQSFPLASPPNADAK
jgi:hypothetical protein